MAIQYYMRAFNTTLVKYVDWVVNDVPDSTGAFSGYPTNQLINITVNRTVQSKVDNFLKPNQSLGGSDGNFFHVNSYDWRNATAPILPPTSLTGIAVERGISSLQPIINATNASPISITTTSPHGLSIGVDYTITIIGVLGNVAANGTWAVTVTGTSTFTLNGSSGTGTYTSGGVAYVPTDMSVLAWDEANQIWKFFFNTNGDGHTVGASQDVSVNNFLVGGYIAIGPDPADTGAIRLSNNQFIFSESDPSGTDIQLIGGDSLNRIKLGSLTTDTVYTPGVIVVDGYIQHDGTGSDTAQTTGFIREKNNTNIIAFRGAGALAGSDIIALGSNSNNNVVLGDKTNTSILYKTSTGSLHQFQVNDLVMDHQVFELGAAFARFTNDSTVISPKIYQTTAALGFGQPLTIQAQDAAAGSYAGGPLVLKSGTQGSGGSAHGTVDIVTGTDASNPKIRVFPTSNVGSDNNSILYGENLFRVDAAQLNPVFRQDARTSAGDGNSYTIQAQDATLGALNKGGNLVLTTGKGFAAVQDGYLFVKTGTGAVAQIIVSPVNQPAMSYPVSSGKVTITGNLEVQGTTTTVDSTVVDIVGQVIHANWSDPAVSSPTGIPTSNAGYSIHRGNTGGAPGVPRDGAAWIWAEPGDLASGADGYWHALTIPGDGAGADPNFSIANSTTPLGVMGLDFSASSDPNPVNGYLASSGSLRATNNVPMAVARTLTLTTTIAAASNLVDLSAIPLNTLTVASTTGFSTSGTILIFSDAGVQTLTYTGTSGGNQFTGVSAGVGIIHTGNYVAQTNHSTTTTSAQSLPTGSILVTSTVGFPAAGVLRIVSNVVAGSGTAQSVQTVTYTSTDATHFLGCTGGTGTTFAGGTVTSLPGGLTSLTQAFGTVDNVLLGTDFGNRILHGSPANNTGHIFNTPSNFLFDFQVNSVPQIRIQANDTNTDGYVEVLEVEPTVVNPRIAQLVRPDTGANAGFNMMLQAQAGQNVSAGTNNNGGILTLSSGPAGTGGTGGVAGVVTINVGSINNSTFNNIDPDLDGYAEWLAIGPTLVNPRLYQATLPGTGTSVGTNFKINAQQGQAVAAGTNNNGGNLVLASGAVGTGGTGGTNGQMEFFWGNTLELTLTDGSLQWSNLITNPPIISQAGGVTNGQTMTMQAQNATSTGGMLVLTSGTGGTTATAGSVNIETGGVDRIVTYPTGSPVLPLGPSNVPYTEFRDTAQGVFIVPVSAGISSLGFAQSATGAQIAQVALASGTGAIMTVHAQDAGTGTGGNLNLASGSGATANGVINFQPGATTQILINATGQFFQWVNTMVNPTINQATTGGASGTTLTVQAQNAATTGGDLTLTSGTGATTAGNVNLQTGGVDNVVVTPTYTTFNDSTGAEAYRVTPVSTGDTTLRAISTATSVTYFQESTVAADGATTTVQAQNADDNGGNLVLTSGTGALTDGYVALQAGGVGVAVAYLNKLALLRGWRRHVTNVVTTYQILESDDYIAADTSTAYTVTMPASPTIGDSYTIKDETGNAATNTLTISGNGVNIDGSASMVLNQDYAAVTLTYTGSQWSVT